METLTLLIGLLIRIGIVSVVVNKATNREKSEVFWGIFAFIFPILALISIHFFRIPTYDKETVQMDFEDELENESHPNPNYSFREFGNEFSENEKAAILIALVAMAKVDKNIDYKEAEKIDTICFLIGMDLDHPAVINLEKLGSNYTYSVLNEMSKEKKEWLILALAEVMAADGKSEQMEIFSLLFFAEKMGMSEEEVMEIINKATSIAKRYLNNV